MHNYNEKNDLQFLSFCKKHNARNTIIKKKAIRNSKPQFSKHFF